MESKKQRNSYFSAKFFPRPFMIFPSGETLNQIKTTAQSFLKTQTTQETKEQLIMSIHTKMLDMNEDQLSSMLEKVLPVTSLNAQRNMLKDNNSAITKAVETKWNVLQ